MIFTYAKHQEANTFSNNKLVVKQNYFQSGMNEDSIDLGESTAKLTSAVENLPQILEKKRKIDSHTNIATSLLDEIKNRNLDEFYRIKDKIVKQGKLEKNIKDYLKDAEFGNENDKLRLLLTYLLGTSPKNLTEILNIYLSISKCD